MLQLRPFHFLVWCLTILIYYYKSLNKTFFSHLLNPPMSPFPTDLIPDILCRLPVKTLLRFKCVSKPWGSLIDDSDFVKLHLDRSFKTNANSKLLLDSCTSNDDTIYTVDFDSLRNLVRLPRPFRADTNKYDSRVIGSCNGIIAVYHFEAGIALWNPSTRKCHYLPALDDAITSDHDPVNFDRNIVLGFGYDVTNDDYKVVKMLKSKTTRNCFITMVYSLKSNSWKRIKDCPYNIPFNYSDGAYLNGRLHWEGDKKGDPKSGNFIFALDLGSEKYHVVPAATDFDFSYYGYKNVGVLGGCLCVFHDHLCGLEPDHVILWVMKEYGVGKSWTEVVKLPRYDWEMFTNIFHTRTVAYSGSGDKILLDDGYYQSAWCNVEDKTGETLHIPGAPQRFSAKIYVESLVSVVPPMSN